MSFPWLKGHGTENDFVLLPDHDGTIHGELGGAFVAALCHRRRGIGADGVMRVVRTQALGEQSAGEWFMDYKNADGSVSEMCGNGIRVFALHLVQEGLADSDAPLVIGTRDGDKTVTFDRHQISVDMGKPELRGVSKVTADGHTWEAQDVRTGNPQRLDKFERDVLDRLFDGEHAIDTAGIKARHDTSLMTDTQNDLRERVTNSEPIASPCRSQ